MQEIPDNDWPVVYNHFYFFKGYKTYESEKFLHGA